MESKGLSQADLRQPRFFCDGDKKGASPSFFLCFCSNCTDRQSGEEMNLEGWNPFRGRGFAYNRGASEWGACRGVSEKRQDERQRGGRGGNG